MSYKRFTQLFFSHDYQTREKMLGQFINIMHYHARIHPQVPREKQIHVSQFHGNTDVASTVRLTCPSCSRSISADHLYDDKNQYYSDFMK